MHAALRDAERGAAAPYVDYPPTPWWFFPGTGLWAAGMVAAIALMAGEHVVGVLLLLALVGLEIGFIRWYRTKRGVSPRLIGGPPELSPVLRTYAVGCVAVLAVVVALYALVGPVAAAVAAFGLVSGGMAAHERSYGAAATTIRLRLAA